MFHSSSEAVIADVGVYGVIAGFAGSIGVISP
jgi:hypothetical protein